YPSSKTCSSCGNVKSDLSLSDRVYQCGACGVVVDRDFNASVNLVKHLVSGVPAELA
ncbi:transposase, partial [Helicobacter salomonis]